MFKFMLLSALGFSSIFAMEQENLFQMKSIQGGEPIVQQQQAEEQPLILQSNDGKFFELTPALSTIIRNKLSLKGNELSLNFSSVTVSTVVELLEVVSGTLKDYLDFKSEQEKTQSKETMEELHKEERLRYELLLSTLEDIKDPKNTPKLKQLAKKISTCSDVYRMLNALQLVEVQRMLEALVRGKPTLLDHLNHHPRIQQSNVPDLVWKYIKQDSLIDGLQQEIVKELSTLKQLTAPHTPSIEPDKNISSKFTYKVTPTNNKTVWFNCGDCDGSQRGSHEYEINANTTNELMLKITAADYKWSPVQDHLIAYKHGLQDRLVICNVETHNEEILDMPQFFIWDFAWSPDGRYLMVIEEHSSGDGATELRWVLFDVENKKCLNSETIYTENIYGICWSQTSSYVALNHHNEDDNQYTLIEINKTDNCTTVETSKTCATMMNFSRDDTYYVESDDDIYSINIRRTVDRSIAHTIPIENNLYCDIGFGDIKKDLIVHLDYPHQQEYYQLDLQKICDTLEYFDTFNSFKELLLLQRIDMARSGLSKSKYQLDSHWKKVFDSICPPVREFFSEHVQY